MSIGPFQILIVLLLVLVLFGRGRISETMGDFGKGIKSFRRGMGEEDTPSQPSAVPAQQIEGPAHEAKPAGEAASDPKPEDKSAS